MIDKALEFITTYINKELTLIFGLTDEKVVAGNLINLDGTLTDNIENKVVISLINIENETFAKNPGTYIQKGENQYSKIDPPVYLNLYLLFAANYTSTNYLESLKMLSASIAALQANSSFERSDFPDMDPSIDRLTMEIHNVPINELSHIWSGIGAKYVPSIIYKMRMLTIQRNQVQATVKGINQLAGDSGVR